MKGRPIVTLFLTLLYISWSAQDESDAIASMSIEEPDRVAHAVNEFGYKLMLKMMKENGDKNVVMSPTGIAGLLAMTLLGSVGSTHDELAKALGFSDSQDYLENRKHHERFGDLLKMLNDNPKTPTEVDNTSTTETYTNETLDDTTDVKKVDDVLSRTVYADVIVVDAKTRIRNKYRDFLHRVYRGDAITTHFEDADVSRHLINDWVKIHTDGKIEEFLTDPLPLNTKMVLLSALYFSGQWARPFVPEHTRNMTFYRPTPVTAELMLNSGGFNYVFKPQYDMHMIAFPYIDNTTTMYVMKPLYPRRATLPDLLDQLDYSIIDQLIENMTNQQCVVRFPKMDLLTKVDLKTSLKALGIKSVFIPGDANFALMVDGGSKSNNDSDIRATVIKAKASNETKEIRAILNSIPNPGVYVDSILHDVKMTVNEYGTVAVAATSAFMSRTATTFYADSPFYMFIRNEKTRLITFSAVIFDPTET